MKIITLTDLRKDLFKIIQNVVQKNDTVEVTFQSKDGVDNSIVIMAKKEYDHLKELEYLEKTGTLDTVVKRMKNSTDADFIEL